MNYEDTGQELKRRIKALIPKNPSILEMNSPFDLFEVEGFSCDDLTPSLGQAGAALSFAKKEYLEEQAK